MKNKYMMLTFFAIITEAIVTYVDSALINDFSFKLVLSLTFGVLISIAYKLDIPEYFNIKSNIPFIGNLITGIIISRGSNYVADFLSILKNLN